MKRFVIAFAALVGGCAHSQPAVQIRYVDRPVTRVEKCIARSDIPARPKLGKRPSRDARVLADILKAKVNEWEGYGAVTERLLQGCAGD